MEVMAYMLHGRTVVQCRPSWRGIYDGVEILGYCDRPRSVSEIAVCQRRINNLQTVKSL
jgi:hypothetical protein